MAVALIVSIAYFYYNWFFFQYAAYSLGRGQVRIRSVVLSFTVNYTLFYFCSVARFHLIVNWSIFFFFLLAEVALIFRGRSLQSVIIALSGTLIGLALNILFRDIAAILMEVPLSAFDNNTADPGNYKQYPVMAGFIMAGLVFQLTGRKRDAGWLRDILKDWKSQRFLAVLMAVMYAYLCLNLLVYYAPGNSLILKLWTMKSSAAVLTGYYLAIVFVHRLCLLAQYRSKNRNARAVLDSEREKEEKLSQIASLDPLTGCKNRQSALETIADALRARRRFCLCFVDLDELKPVNDNMGHNWGNEYLLAVVRHLRDQCGKKSADADNDADNAAADHDAADHDAADHDTAVNDSVFRYGGDEFIVLFFDTDLDTAREHVVRAARELAAEGNSVRYPFPMSVSIGAVDGDEFADADRLIEAADRRMYEEKLRYKAARGTGGLR